LIILRRAFFGYRSGALTIGGSVDCRILDRRLCSIVGLGGFAFIESGFGDSRCLLSVESFADFEVEFE
jgi:hypothetical protein